jgi:hypothetical protein
MKALLLLLALGASAPAVAATPAPAAARPAPTGAARARASQAKVAAAVSFVVLLAAGGKLYHRLGKRAEAEEAEALLDAAFEKLGSEHPEILEELRRTD